MVGSVVTDVKGQRKEQGTGESRMAASRRGVAAEQCPLPQGPGTLLQHPSGSIAWGEGSYGVTGGTVRFGDDGPTPT